MLDFALRYWMQVSFGVIISLFSYLAKSIRKFKKNIECNKMGIKILLKRETVEYYEELIKKEKVTIDERETFNELVKAYKCFDPSRLVDDLTQKISTMPTD